MEARSGPAVDAAEGVVGERARVVFVVVGEELGLVGGHVDRDGALGLAGFAGEAEVEGFTNLLVVPVVGEDLALHELPEHMGAAAGGVLLFAGGHDSWGTWFRRRSCGRLRRRRSGGWREAKRAVVFGEGEVGFGLPGRVVGAEAEVFVDLVRVDELVGVQFVGGVPDALEAGGRRPSTLGRTSLGEARRGPGRRRVLRRASRRGRGRCRRLRP